MIWLCALVGAVAAFFYARYRFRLWKATRAEQRRLKAHAAAKAKHEAKRTLAQRVHGRMPEAALRRIMRHRPQRRGKGVRIARRGPGFGRYEKIDPAQHIAAIGTTGSGKTSVLRVLAAWALRRPDWQVICLDGKWGASVAPYLRHCRVITDLTEIEAFLADLVDREFPARGRMTRRPHLAIVADESRLFNALSPGALADLVTIMQTGRELGVHVWAGLQDFKASSVPSEIRMLFTARLAHLVPTAEDGQVIFKELAAAGWRPDRLERSGQVIIWEPQRKRARVSFALWMSETALERTANRICLIKVPPRRDAASARPSVRYETPAQSHTRTGGRTADALTDRQVQALAVLDVRGALTPADLGRELNIDRKRAHDVLAQLTMRRLVTQTAYGPYALAAAPANAPQETES